MSAQTVMYDRREWTVEPTGNARRPFVLRGKRGATLDLVKTVGSTLYPMRGSYMWPGRFRVAADGKIETF